MPSTQRVRLLRSFSRPMLISHRASKERDLKERQHGQGFEGRRRILGESIQEPIKPHAQPLVRTYLAQNVSRSYCVARKPM